MAMIRNLELLAGDRKEADSLISRFRSLSTAARQNQDANLKAYYRGIADIFEMVADKVQRASDSKPTYYEAAESSFQEIIQQLTAEREKATSRATTENYLGGRAEACRQAIDELERFLAS